MSDLTRFRDVSHRGIAQSPIVISSPDSGDNGLERRASGPAEGDTGAARKRRNLATKITITSNSKPTCEQEPDNESQAQLLDINKDLTANSLAISSLSPTPPPPKSPRLPIGLRRCVGTRTVRAQGIVTEELEMERAGLTVSTELSWTASNTRRQTVQECASIWCEVLLEDGAFDFFVQECTNEMLKAFRESGDPSMEFVSDDYFCWFVDKLLCSEFSKFSKRLIPCLPSQYLLSINSLLPLKISTH